MYVSGFVTSQCQSHDSLSPEDEYRSSRNIAISLFRRYRRVIERGGGDNLKVYFDIYYLIWVLRKKLLSFLLLITCLI